MNVWTYWDGPMPDRIRLCLKTIQHHEPSVTVMTENYLRNKMRAFGDDNDIGRLEYNHRSDYARWFILAHEGGIWLDADCILLRSLAWFRDHASMADFFHYQRFIGSSDYPSAFLASERGGAVVASCYEACRQIVASGERLKWTTIGPKLLREVCEEESSGGTCIWTMPGQLIHPIPWRPEHWVEKFWIDRSDDEHGKLVNPHAWMYMLTRKSFGPLEHQDEGTILAGRSFMSYLFRRALGRTRYGT